MKKSKVRGPASLSIVVLSMVLMYSVVHSGAQQAPHRTRVINLVEPAGVPPGFAGTHRQGLFTIQDFKGGVSFAVHVSKLGWICGPGQGVPGNLERMFYTIYVQTPSLGRFRVYNFNTECNFGNFQSSFKFFPPGTPADPLFQEPITVDIDLEADDNLDLNVFPFAAHVLSGQD
jgi:hypothetical protein